MGGENAVTADIPGQSTAEMEPHVAKKASNHVFFTAPWRNHGQCICHLVMLFRLASTLHPQMGLDRSLGQVSSSQALYVDKVS